MIRQFFTLTMFLCLIAVTVQGQADQNKPPKPKINLVGVYYYNGVGAVIDSSRLDSIDWKNYKELPIKSKDTIQFLDSANLIVNHNRKYSYGFNYKWSDVGLNDSKFWQIYIIVEGQEYFVHFTYNGIEMQTHTDRFRWYGRFDKEKISKKKK